MTLPWLHAAHRVTGIYAIYGGMCGTHIHLITFATEKFVLWIKGVWSFTWHLWWVCVCVRYDSFWFGVCIEQSALWMCFTHNSFISKLPPPKSIRCFDASLSLFLFLSLSGSIMPRSFTSLSPMYLSLDYHVLNIWLIQHACSWGRFVCIFFLSSPENSIVSPLV